MKKFVNFSALCAVLVALLLTSCQKDKCVVTFDSNGGTLVAAVMVENGKKLTEPKKPKREGCSLGGWYKEPSFTTLWDFSKDVVTSDIILYAKWTAPTVEVELSRANYYGFSGESHNFTFSFMNVEKGVGYVLDINSPTATESNGNYSIAEGTYDFDPDNTMLEYTIDDGDSYVYYFATNSGRYFNSGKLVVSKVGSDYKLAGDFIDGNGKMLSFSYQGPLSARYQFEEIFSYEWESITPENVEKTAQQCTYYRLGDEFTNEITFEGEDFVAQIVILTESQNLDGTYEINRSMSSGSVVASPGGDLNSGYVHPSFLMTYNNGGISDKVWFLTSGTVTVNGTDITVDAASYFGSSVKITCNNFSRNNAPARKGKVSKGMSLDTKKGLIFKK